MRSGAVVVEQERSIWMNNNGTKLTLAFYVNAVTPFQIQLSQVKYTHPPRDLHPLLNGRRGNGKMEKERERSQNYLNLF